MSTLREEILKCLNDYFYDIVSPPYATDEIIKLIEQRIDQDEMISSILNNPNNTMSHIAKTNNIPSHFYMLGFNRCLELVKGVLK
jgi:hypothetical protein